jgi:prevent-host-death family protein
MQHWQLQDAKNRFSEVVKKAVLSGPQIVTKRGVETVVIISVDEYRKLTKPKTSLTEFFKKSPLKNSDINLERIKEYPREIDL